MALLIITTIGGLVLNKLQRVSRKVMQMTKLPQETQIWIRNLRRNNWNKSCMGKIKHLKLRMHLSLLKIKSVHRQDKKKRLTKLKEKSCLIVFRQALIVYQKRVLDIHLVKIFQSSNLKNWWKTLKLLSFWGNNWRSKRGSRMSKIKYLGVPKVIWTQILHRRFFVTSKNGLSNFMSKLINRTILHRLSSKDHLGRTLASYPILWMQEICKTSIMLKTWIFMNKWKNLRTVI